MNLARPAAALAAAACALLVLTGCTGTTPAASVATPSPATTASPDRVVGDALAATLSAGSARASIDAGTAAGAVTANGPLRFAPFAADLSATVQGRAVSVRTVDGSSWVEFGGRWQRVSSGLVPVDALTGALHAAPGLRDVVADGTEDLGGVPTTRYRGTADLEAAAAASADPATAAGLRSLAGLVTGRPAVEVWLGPDGRVAQLRVSPAGGSATGPVTLRLTDLGVPTDITPPSP
ncbi:hypothetical protein [Pseudonocardia endophytica]|uniref:Lipoprotein LprG n=1 Tax=Pseudonocardia endophytica TaxID=401976 RepID=A0A4R1HUM1_PSEEN|nr:hypothetical protein [Pseudonocardia endophytica]TCK26404.1 hypothetical protein EV378_2239 [Pseudonocardia endophytica]